MKSNFFLVTGIAAVVGAGAEALAHDAPLAVGCLIVGLVCVILAGATA